MKFWNQRMLIAILALLLIVGGSWFGVGYVRKMLLASRAIRFATSHNFDAGNLDPQLIEPWMSLRYVAVAYAVPQAYFLRRLAHTAEDWRQDFGHKLIHQRSLDLLPLRHIEARLHLNSQTPKGEEPHIIVLIRQFISDYRQNPVVTGLIEGEVKPWMNMQYLSNSTGIALEDLFAAVGIAPEGHAYMPFLRLLDPKRQQDPVYEGGVGDLTAALLSYIEDRAAAAPQVWLDLSPEYRELHSQNKIESR